MTFLPDPDSPFDDGPFSEPSIARRPAATTSGTVTVTATGANIETVPGSALAAELTKMAGASEPMPGPDGESTPLEPDADGKVAVPGTAIRVPVPQPALGKPPISAKRSDVITKRDGVDSWALYVEYLVYHHSTGKLYEQVKILLAEHTLSVSRRKAGHKQARWRLTSCKSHDEARAKFIKLTANVARALNQRAQVREFPLLVQLTSVDVEQLRRGEVPFGRYAGQHHLDKLSGKINDEDWRPSPDAAVVDPTAVRV